MKQQIQTLSQTLKSLSHTRISYPMIQITSYLDKRKQQQQANRLLGCVLENKSRLNLLILPAARLGPSTWQLSDTALNHSRFSPRTSCPICWCWMLCFPSATRFTDVAKKKRTQTDTINQKLTVWFSSFFSFPRAEWRTLIHVVLFLFKQSHLFVSCSSVVYWTV